jgi:hypothetical protein
MGVQFIRKTGVSNSCIALLYGCITKCEIVTSITLPATFITLERTFPTLKLLKNYLRSTMNEEKFNGLTMTKTNKSEKNHRRSYSSFFF